MLELSGNAARDNRLSVIDARHLMLACANDEELAKLTRGAVFRDGGVLPNIHAKLLPRSGAAESVTPSFDETFKEMLAGGPGGGPGRALIDPRDGCHYRLPSADEDEGECIAVPELDAATGRTAAARQRVALTQLTDGDSTHAAAFDAAAADPAREQEARLQAVRRAQRSTAPAIDAGAFGRLAAEIGQDFKTDLQWSAEGLAALQAAAEAYLVARYTEAQLNAIHRSSLAIAPKALALAHAASQLRRN
jgi:histone H3/H4